MEEKEVILTQEGFDNLEKELSTAKGYKTWINFAKEQYAKQIVDIPDVDRISALEQAIMEAEKFEGKGVNAAGGRCRKALQEIKKEIKPVRDLITEIKNSRKK